MKEEYAIVLDYLPYGKPTDIRSRPLAQVVGYDYFTLLEVYIRPGKSVELLEKIYVGKDLEKREKVEKVRGRIRYTELTSTAQRMLEEAVARIVKEREKDFVAFFNRAGPITVRRHQLELLPGIGKKHMFKILEEREKKPFESFEDIKNRVPLCPNPMRAVVGRILEEIQGVDKYHVFTKP